MPNGNLKKALPNNIKNLITNNVIKSERIITRDYRNNRIGAFLKEMDLTEGRSTGIPKMRFFMERNGSSAPVFQTDGDLNYFLVTLYPHPDTIVEKSAEQLTPQVKQLLRVVTGEMTRDEIQSLLALRDRKSFRAAYIKPALADSLIEMTIPDKPNTRMQKYRLTPKGLFQLESLT